MITRIPKTYWPKDSMPVWRYLSFDKFVNLLIHREIQFTRATLFSDQNELRLLDAPKAKRELTKQRAIKLEKRITRLRETTYISCWSLGMSESYPLWKFILAAQGMAWQFAPPSVGSEPCWIRQPTNTSMEACVNVVASQRISN